MSDRGGRIDAQLVSCERVGVGGFAEPTVTFAGRQGGVGAAGFDHEGSAPAVSGEYAGSFQLRVCARDRAGCKSKVASKLADGGESVTIAQYATGGKRRDLCAQLFVWRHWRLRIDLDYQATARERRKSVVQARRRIRSQHCTDATNAMAAVPFATGLIAPGPCTRELVASNDSTSQANATPIPPSRLTQLVRIASRAVSRSSSNGCGRRATHCVAPSVMTTTRRSKASRPIR
jgi:hypothetical protein